MKKIRETEYVYAAARVHSVDGALMGRDKYIRLAATPGEEAFARMLGEFGYDVSDGVFPSLEKKLEVAFGFISDIAPEPKLFFALRYPYDCNSLKAAIKCEFISGFDFSALYSPCGSISEKQVEKAVHDRDFSVFPEHMAKAAAEALKEYSETADPQLIDLCLDRACCEDMLSLARECKDEVIADYVKNRIDMMNILTALRIIRMGKDRAFFESASSDGGFVEKSALAEAVSEGEGALLALTLKTSLGNKLPAEGFPSFSETERIMDAAFAESCEKYKHSVFGSASLLWYLCATENEVKNIRIIIAGRAAGQSAEKIIERIRESYV